MAIPEKRKFPRVGFERGVDAWIMSIDGTWRLRCKMRDASAQGARLKPASMEKLKEKEFFLLLSSTGLAYRRCELAWINGDEIGVKFLQMKR
ncbi:PilZ domain-containing protein [Rhodopseudomonas palustris]|uniref:Type IV pilus assembly PilZ n=3 Tax=Rhodopseudomonas TaxID=1073 RepID=Q137U9_RHOPS|nr:type IV pilus assembly PilZ [Rhodopseudomonas palustris BisB5]MBB1092558.1 PilZ domain-containing protein [Rhodopseudomonas palustris]SEP20365.1 PilZ domain-containing protein [Rhodopseudomonas pseudopalustris]